MKKEEINENGLKEQYFEFQLLSEQMQKLEQQLQTLNAQVTEIKDIKTSLDEFKGVKKESELFFPIAAGIYAKGKVTNSNELFINVGSNIVVNKNIEDAKELLSSQEKKVEGFIEEINTQWTQIYEKLLIMDQNMKNV